MTNRFRASVRSARRKAVGVSGRSSVDVELGTGPGSIGELVFCGPLPPAKTGIAAYDAAVLEGLRRIGFFERHRMDIVWPVEPKHGVRFPGYRLGVFQLGNNVEFHLDVYRAAYLTQALIVLHDLALDDFVRGLKAAGEPLGYMAAREAARLAPTLRMDDAVLNEPMRAPWAAHVARRASGIIVHADFGRRYLEEAGCRTPIFVVPHPAVEDPKAFEEATPRARELRESMRARGARHLVVAAGDINEAKCLDALAAASAQLGDDTAVVIVGRRIEGYDVDRVIEAAGAAQRVAVHADVDDGDFLAWLLAADVVVDLRYPHRGEVSGSLARSMQAGRPSIVSATGTYNDVPDDAVIRISRGPADPVELSAAIRSLLEDDDLRERLGTRAAAHMRELRDSEATARGYERAIERTLTLVRDPARKAMALWGKSLVDVGISESMVRQGFGMEYARALESFKGTSSPQLGRDQSRC
jgi:glycosyltransferase involved in cell wall biosynthesis